MMNKGKKKRRDIDNHNNIGYIPNQGNVQVVGGQQNYPNNGIHSGGGVIQTNQQVVNNQGFLPSNQNYPQGYTGGQYNPH